jgi:hypothetical protein
MNTVPIDFIFPKGKTTYHLFLLTKKKTTIVLDKWVADILQLSIPNVSLFLEETFLDIEYKNNNRKYVGSLVRIKSTIEANGHQINKRRVLGWNDDDLLNSI